MGPRTYVIDDRGRLIPMATSRYFLLLQGRFSIPRWRNRSIRIAHRDASGAERVVTLDLDAYGRAAFSHLPRNQPPIRRTIGPPVIDRGG